MLSVQRSGLTCRAHRKLAITALINAMVFGKKIARFSHNEETVTGISQVWKIDKVSIVITKGYKVGKVYLVKNYLRNIFSCTSCKRRVSFFCWEFRQIFLTYR